MVMRLMGKGGPLNKIYKMLPHAAHPLALLSNNKKQSGPPHRTSRHNLHDMMNAPGLHTRLRASTTLQFAEDLRIVHKDTLQFRSHFIALGHDVVGGQMLALGER